MEQKNQEKSDQKNQARRSQDACIHEQARQLLETMSIQNFICFRDLPLLYGRVPKVANSSIKAALYRLLASTPQKGERTTSDTFWRNATHGETSMLSNFEARMRRGTHFCFSFVRNPFDRLVSAYNNKILELEEIPGPMQRMGLSKNSTFREFLECISYTSDEDLDVHLLPQSIILCHEGTLIPNFVGRLETMTEDWIKLHHVMQSEGLPLLGKLPQKNVRRSDDRGDVSQYFADPGLVQLIVERYGDDLDLFYGDVDLQDLSRCHLS